MAVDAVVSSLSNNITQLLNDEVDLLSGVKDKVVSIQKMLPIVNGFLQDTEGKRTNHEVKALIDHIRDDADEAQDVIDEYVAHKEKHNSKNILMKGFHSVDYASRLHDVDKKINKLNKRIDDIYVNRDKYGIQQGQSAEVRSNPDPWVLLRRINVAEDDKVVGFDNHVEHVIGLLIGGLGDIMSINGMGGLGKTTLARKVYKDNRIKNHFKYCAWAFVSQDCRPRDVLARVLKCLNLGDSSDTRNNEKEEDVVKKMKTSMRKALAGSRYLIVLDDIWDVKVWRKIEDAFPDDKIGSKILITSREVAFHNPSSPYQLQFLSNEDSWLLFLRKLIGEKGCLEAEQEEVARKMVHKCKGLPLSIVVLAGLLQNTDPSEWSALNKDVISKIAEDDVGCVKDILKLSYDHLPRTLKPCFLYLGIFPEDHQILTTTHLIKLWIAEGLIEPSKDKSLEEVADEDYLKKLINRNLLQVTHKRSDGRAAKICQVHDHIRELCISEAKDGKFFQVCTHNNVEKMMGMPRRVSVHCLIEHYFATPRDHSSTRSLFFFNKSWTRSIPNVENVIKDSKSIRVLHIDNKFFFAKIPKDISNLIHLRYLKVEVQIFERIHSICELTNLETLNIANSSRISLPDKIWKLKRLRHLIFNYCGGDVTLPRPSEEQTLYYLQTLIFIGLNQENVNLIERGKFPNLRKLGFQRVPKGDEITSLLERLQCLEHLKTLKIRSPPAFAKSNKFPRSLTKITLDFSAQGYNALKEESMNVLGNLPSLQILKLCGVSPEFELFRIAAGFKQLQVLIILSLGCHSWKLEQGAMPKLRRLVIKGCKHLTQLPNELCSSSTLREVEVCQGMAEILENLENVKKMCRVSIKD